MLWYVLQTKTGEEEKLAEMIRKVVPRHLYGECFIVYHEQLWRRQQQNFVHVKRAFPGYVFITSKEPEALFFCLKKIPAMVKMMTDDESFFLYLDPGEAAFLEQIMDENHVIGLSFLETDGKGNILQVSGPLKSCISQIVYCKFGKRYVLVRLQLLGQEKEVFLGIILKEDICEELRYGKIEAPMEVPRQYKIGEKAKEKISIENKSTGKKANIARQAVKEKGTEISEKAIKFAVGELVTVTDGIFRELSGRIYQVKNDTVRIGIQLFGRNMEMEVPLEIISANKQNLNQ